MSRFKCLPWARSLGVLIAIVPLVAPGLAGQTGSITGRVTDATSAQPIASAQVFIADLDLGVLSQQSGSYNLQNVPAGTQTVTVQRLGYREVVQTVQVSAGQATVADFQLAETALQLDEVIVTGTPGGTQRRAIGNTVARLEASDVLQDVAVSDMTDLLTGRTPGVRFQTQVGDVGTGSSIQIRGMTSFDSDRSQPLLYVDGVRVNSTDDAGPNTGEGQRVSVLNDFNPEDIESIEIIKGPAAASLYGTEASSGVIQIITKRGAEGAPQFNFSTRQGVNYLSDPAGKVGQMYTCPTDPSPGPTACSQESELVPYNMYDEANRYIREGYFPWKTDNLYDYGYSQSYNLDVRGGTEQVRYFLSANFDDDTGIEWYNTDQTARLRANVSVLLSEQVSLDVSTGFVDGSTRLATPTTGDGGVWQDLLWSNGYYLDRVTPFDQPGSNPRIGGFQEHLPSDVAEVEVTRDYSRFTGAATLNFNSGEFEVMGMGADFTNRMVVGVDKGWDTNRQLWPLEDGVVPEHLRQFTDTWAAQYSETTNGQMVYDRPIYTNLSVDMAGTLNLRPNDNWSFATSVGAQYYVDQDDSFSNEGTGFASPLSTTINQLSQSQILTEYEFIENKSLGFYVQEEIGWNDRLFLTGAVRFDDNSTFGSDAPAQRYPKLSGTWVVSEENFWNIDLINSLRLRSAWGKSGRQPASTSGQNIYVAIPGPGGASAIRPDSPGNPGIEPEVSQELEVGFDFAMLDDRLSGEFTHYWNKTEQALLGIAQPPSFGFPGEVDQNLGQIDSWGWEAILTARLYESPSITFDLDLTADHLDNEIVSLGSFPGDEDVKIGFPHPVYVTDNWVLRAELDPENPNTTYTSDFGQTVSAWCDSGISTAGNGEHTSQHGYLPGGPEVPCAGIFDREIMAGPAYDPYTFTVQPRIGLLGGNLQLFALAEGRYGRTRGDDVHQWSHTYNNTKASRLHNDPMFVASERLNTTGSSWELEIYKAGFWKLREVGARYNLPQGWVSRAGADRASISLSARNLATLWTESSFLSGIPISDPEFGDPEDADSGGVYSMPALSNISATIRVTF